LHGGDRGRRGKAIDEVNSKKRLNSRRNQLRAPELNYAAWRKWVRF
jgi:hypothetical protein